MQLRVLYQDPYLVAVDKPAGFHVHPPEDPSHRISSGSNCLKLLRRQLDQYLYPVHRLDAATSGVLLFALDPETARELQALFQSRGIRKTYYCVVRGWMHEAVALDRPLAPETDRSATLPSETRITPLARIELDAAVGRYSTARYSLLRAEPLTGRLHQIRRHLAGAGYPIVGDTVHGDGDHNRFFRSGLKIPGLMLKAQSLAFQHPKTGQAVWIQSRWAGKWHQVFDRFGLCPVETLTN